MLVRVWLLVQLGAMVVMLPWHATRAVELLVDDFVDSWTGNCSHGSEATGECNLRAGVSYCGTLQAGAAECVLRLRNGTHVLTEGEMLVGVNLSAPMQIVGGGSDAVIVDGAHNGGQRWLRVLDVHVPISLTRLTVSRFILSANADVVGGAVLHLADVSDFSVSETVFSDNREMTGSGSGGGGGAVYANGAQNSSWTGCRFRNNSAASSYGGAMYIASSGATGVFSRCSWEDNSAGVDGGALYMREAHAYTFTDSVWRNNWAADHGGAIWMYNSDGGDFTNCSLVGNDAEDQGGAVYMDTSDNTAVANSSWEDNVASFGGALYLYSSASATFRDCRWRNNSATNGGAANLFFSYTVTITHNVWQHNKADLGGSIYLDATNVDMTSTEFANNEATQDGGAWYFKGSNTIQSSDCTYEGNRAESGGSIYFATDSAGASFLRTTWRGDRASLGGSVQLATRVRDVNFTDCDWVASTAELGGALYIQRDVAAITCNRCSWTRNVAEVGGAVHLVSGNQVSFLKSTWTANSGLSGGGVFAGLSNRLAITECTAVGNKATTGGVIALFHDNVLNVSSSNMTQNEADTGAAIASAQRTTRSTIVNTSFEANRGGIAGGALSLGLGDNWTVSDCLFAENESPLGGALRASLSKQVLLSNCTVRHNVALNGGGLAADGGTQVLVRDSVITGNMATASGGAAFVSASSLTASTTSFADNSAGGSGGAIAAASGATIALRRGCTLQRNVAAYTGGAIVVEDASHLRLSATLLRANNASSADGGAIAVQGGSDVTLHTTECESNRAGGSGGAIFMGDADTAAVMVDSSLRWNAAGFGGAISSATQNVSIAQTEIVGNAAKGGAGIYWDAGAPYPEESNFSFHNNSAFYGDNLATPMVALAGPARRTAQSGATVPAMDVHIVDAYNQTVHTADDVVVDVEFNTVSQPGGSPAVSGGTVILSAAGVAAFDDVVLTSAPGTAIVAHFFTSASSSSSASSTVQAAFCNISIHVCRTGQIIVGDVCETCAAGLYTWSNDADACTNCLRHSTCPADDGVSVILAANYWRQTNTSTLVRSCPADNACQGGSDPDKQCATGSSGPMCLVCEDGYYAESALAKCQACESTQRFAPIIIVGGVLLLAGVIAMWLHHSRPSWARALSKAAAYRVCWRIAFVYVQIISQYPFLFSVDYPASYRALMASLGITNVAFAAVFSPACYRNGYDFFDTLVVQTVGGFVLLAAILVYFGVRALLTTYPDKRRELWSQAFAWFLVLTYVLFPGTSTAVFETFSCDDNFDGDQSYLRADYSISCNSQRYRDYRAYAVFMILLYPIGIPLLYAGVLWTYRKRVCPHMEAIAKDLDNAGTPLGKAASSEMQEISHAIAEVEQLVPSKHVAPHLEGSLTRMHGELQSLVRDKDRSLQSVRLLFESYRPALWPMEVLECVRRLMMSSVLVFFWPGTGAQVAVAIAISAAFLLLYAWLQPYREPAANLLMTSVLVTIIVQLFVTLLLLEDTLGKGSIVGEFLLVVVFLGPLFPALLYGCRWVRNTFMMTTHTHPSTDAGTAPQDTNNPVFEHELHEL